MTLFSTSCSKALVFTVSTLETELFENDAFLRLLAFEESLRFYQRFRSFQRERYAKMQ